MASKSTGTGIKAIISRHRIPDLYGYHTRCQPGELDRREPRPVRQRTLLIALWTTVAVLVSCILVYDTLSRRESSPHPESPAAKPAKNKETVPRVYLVKVMGSPSTDSLDLLRELDPMADSILGDWKQENQCLISPEVAFARTHLPCVAPQEYDLKLVVERISGDNSFNVGLAAEGRQFMVAFDGWEGGVYCGLDMLNGKPFFQNETTFKKKVFVKGIKRTIRCSVRKKGLTVTIDGEKPIEWKVQYDQCAVYKEWEVWEKRSLFLGSYSSAFCIHEIILTPVTGSAIRYR